MTKLLPQGKGWFIWQIKRVYNGDPLTIAQKAKEQGISWVSIKVCDRASNYNLRPVEIAGITVAYKDDIVQPLVDALKAQSISVYGWGYCYINNAYFVSPQKEAQKAVDRVKQFNLDGYFIDAEYEAKNQSNNAKTYSAVLRSGLPDKAIGLCSYRFPSLHNDFPYREFLNICDFHAPQVYWVGSNNSAEQLERSVVELKKIANIPVIPLGISAQDDSTIWKPTEIQINNFHNKVVELNLQAEGWYEWGDAINAGVEKFVANISWDGKIILPPPPTEKSRYVGSVLPTVFLGLQVRESPITGLKIGKLNPNQSFEGDVLVTVQGDKWLNITKPLSGWISLKFTKYTDSGEIIVIPPPMNTKKLGLYYVIPHYRPNTTGPAISPCSRNTKMFENASQLDYTPWSKYLLEINKYDNSHKEENRLQWINDPNAGPSKGVNENNKYRWIGLTYPGNVVLVEDIVDGQDGRKWAKIKSVSNNTSVAPDATKINYIKTPHLVHQAFGWNAKNELFLLTGNKGGCVVPVVGESEWYIPMDELRPIHTLQSMNVRNAPNTSAEIIGGKAKGEKIYISKLSERNNINDDLWGLTDEGWIVIKVSGTRYTDWQFV